MHISQRSEELGLFVVDEEDNETLLLHRISSDDIYRKQEGIFWFQQMNYIIFPFPIVANTLCQVVSSGYNMHFYLFSDTIISWRDPEYSTELALSFQETTGCSYIW